MSSRLLTAEYFEKNPTKKDRSVIYREGDQQVEAFGEKAIKKYKKMGWVTASSSVSEEIDTWAQNKELDEAEKAIEEKRARLEEMDRELVARQKELDASSLEVDHLLVPTRTKKKPGRPKKALSNTSSKKR